jgi:hypothetical protein
MLRRMSLLLVFLAVLSACSSGGDSDNANDTSGSTTPPTTGAPAAGYPLDDTLRLDQAQVLGSHNSYHGRPYKAVLDELAKLDKATALGLDYEHAPLPEQFDLGVRQIELDVYADPDGGKYADLGLAKQLDVKVPENPGWKEPGFKVIHQAGIDNNSTCVTFVECLQLLKTWSDAHPGHVAMQVQIEMKDTSVPEQAFADLEAEIESVFDADEIITPDIVRGNAKTLGEAVKANGWPTLGATRGKVYFTLDNEGLRDQYTDGHPSLEGRLLFTPSSPGQDDAAFAKLNDPFETEKIKAALAANMIVRTRADADTLQARANDTRSATAALSSGAQIVSTDYEQPDPKIGNGYTVKIPGGTPARCAPGHSPANCKPTDIENPEYLTTR